MLTGACVGWLNFSRVRSQSSTPLQEQRRIVRRAISFSCSRKFRKHEVRQRRVLALFHGCNDLPGEIDALTALGATYFFREDRAEGVKLFEQALTLSQSLGDIWRQARVNYLFGWDHSDYQRTFTYWEKAVVLFSEAGDQSSQVNLLCDIALYRALNGDIELAQKHLDEATMLFPLDRKIDSWINYQITKSIIVLVHGDYEQAHTLLQEVVAKSEILGNRFEYLWAKVRLGHLSLHEDNISDARRDLCRNRTGVSKE